MGFESFEIWSAVKQVKYRETFDTLHEMLLNSHGDVDNAISAVLDVVCNAVHSEAGTFWFYSRSGDGLIHARAAYGGGDVSNIYLQYGEGIAGGVIKTGEPTMVMDCQADERWAAKSDAKSGFITKSMICVPLKTDAEIFGCIQLINKTDGNLFDDSDFDLCESLAEEISRQFIKLNIMSDGRVENNVAVMYCGVKNFTLFTERFGAKQVSEIVNLILSHVTQKITENHGTIESYNMDQTIAYFVDTNDRNDSSYNACCAAMQIQNSVKEFNQMVEERYGLSVEFNIGIATGEAFIGNIGTSVFSSYSIVGHVSKIASYLKDKCPSNKTYISRDCLESNRNRIKATKNTSGLFSSDKLEFESFTLDSVKETK